MHITSRALLKTLAALGLCLSVSACVEGEGFTLGGPSDNTYAFGRSNPGTFQRAMTAAQSCVWARERNCGPRINGAEIYATSDYDLYAAARLSIEYADSNGNTRGAQQAAVRLLRELPGNSYAIRYLQENPLPPRPDISFTRSDLLIVGAMIAATAGGGAAAAAATTNTRSAPSSSAPRASGGYKITDIIPYERGSQEVIARGRCDNGRSFNIRLYPDNGPNVDHAILNLFGSSIRDVAAKYCRQG